jgi:hypothetical protein
MHNSILAIFSSLQLVRSWLSSREISSPLVARLLCKVIPASCPFERELKLFNRTLIYIPPLCKLNPFYEQFVELRFKSLVYLAEQCGEDLSSYY